MEEGTIKLIVYSTSSCHKCEKLKNFLSSKNVFFIEESFDTNIQSELMMNNNFGNPPILDFNGDLFSSEKLFNGETLDKDKVMEILNGK